MKSPQKNPQKKYSTQQNVVLNYTTICCIIIFVKFCKEYSQEVKRTGKNEIHLCGIWGGIMLWDGGFLHKTKMDNSFDTMKKT